MKKRLRKTKRHAPLLPPIGHYVFAFRDSDGRLREATDAEMNTLIKQAQIVERDAPHDPTSTVSRTPAADTGAPAREVSAENSSGETREATPRVEAFGGPACLGLESETPPEDALALVKAEMARLGGFGAAPMQPERSARTTTANGIASVVSLVPKMTDGDLGITTAWANQVPPDTVYVTETRWRYIPSKSSPSRWLADLGVVLRWGAALIALAILLVVAFDYRSAHDGPSEQSAMTFNLSF